VSDTGVVAADPQATCTNASTAMQMVVSHATKGDPVVDGVRSCLILWLYG
jgi:hypothetical protein